MHKQPDPFGRELRRLRKEKGLTLRELSKEARVSFAHISNLEHGRKEPTAEIARNCDRALDAMGKLTALVPEMRRRTRRRTETTHLMLTPPKDNDHPPRIGRRAALFGAAASLMASGDRAPAVPDEQTLTRFRNLFEETRSLGQTASPINVLGAAVSISQLLQTATHQAHPSLQPELTLLRARFAEFAGWMAQESGDDGLALEWTNHAANLASQAGDRDLRTYALVRRGLIEMYQGNAALTIALAQRAQLDERTPARIRGLAAQREAQGHALAGDRDSALRALDNATALLARARRSDSRPILGSQHVVDQAAIATGWCLSDLGLHKRATEVLDREVLRIPQSASRARLRFGARRALAHARANDLDHACELTRELLGIVSVVESATVASDLRHLAKLLAPHQDYRPIGELYPLLVHALS
ncbi:helix-turn-helix domain-containing protein [Allokutzneria sp. A3M-2-11 16]|uniref:helix-turn-helix domain-containing protein n=1 Tax=Allokutzneria sp. A3M-2-11 16 TaxID=2962043 RepID=UPI0020B8A5A2|nr:helix-turn-helix transcriptional regulator [Allokutzneria sp. A3M-2-11 16]MCP3802077.1 helix-turn-helix domain-containing protein [Allokutzneria sp. A3M-2-11 16]